MVGGRGVATSGARVGVWGEIPVIWEKRGAEQPTSRCAAGTGGVAMLIDSAVLVGGAMLIVWSGRGECRVGAWLC